MMKYDEEGGDDTPASEPAAGGDSSDSGDESTA